MRTVRTKVYKFSELNDKAKEVAIEWYRNSNTEVFWAKENQQSMEKFAEIFPIKVTNWSYGGRGEGVDFHFTCDDAIEELSGQRLATYLWNNYRSEIYSKKYYSLWSKTEKSFEHYKEGYPVLKSRRSKIQLEKYNCPLTGFYMDNEILHPIWEFMDKPDNRNFKDLLEHCFEDWVTACNNDVEEQNSDEYISENLEVNKYEFTFEGKPFNQ